MEAPLAPLQITFKQRDALVAYPFLPQFYKNTTKSSQGLCGDTTPSWDLTKSSMSRENRQGPDDNLHNLK